MSRGTYVQALRDFGYDAELGKVMRGQVFSLGGHVNDRRLQKHKFVKVLDPQPSKKVLEQLPACGACGAIFTEPYLRDRCGHEHELTAAELEQAKRASASKRVDDLAAEGALHLPLPRRVVTVGA